MAAALAASRSRVVVRRAGDLRKTIYNVRVRALSSNDHKPTSGQIYHELGDQDAKKVWPDREFSFDLYHQLKFPLPGNTAPAPSAASPPLSTAPLLPLSPAAADVASSYTRHHNQAEIFGQHKMRQTLLAELQCSASNRSSMDVELKVQECPMLMRKDFQTLFPGIQVMSGDFTVVSLCQKTSNDMSGWSEQVEEERESLLQMYSETAQELCAVLHNAGFWADFVDPCSGKPHLGPHTTDSMFETDERYRHFGFDIEDLGCCKVISHHKWGSKAFVGCVFTNAPADSPILVELTQFTEPHLTT